MKTTFARQFAVTAGLILLSFLILGTSFISLLYTYLIDDKERELTANADAIADLAAAYSTTGELERNWDFRIFLSFASRVSTGSAVICDENGTVILCSCDELGCEHLGVTMPEDKISAALSSGTVYFVGVLPELYEDERYVVGRPLVSQETGEVTGLLFVSSGAADTTELLEQLSNIFILSSFGVILIAFIATGIIARNQARPLREMAAAARKFARGDFTARVSDYGREDEVGELAAAFNNMAGYLERSNATRSDFIANISHELKTPMTTISGFIDGILDGTIPPERQKEYLQSVSQEVRRLSRLVRRMLDVSRLQSSAEQPLKLDRFDVAELLGRTLLSFEQRINDKQLQVEAELGEEPVFVAADYDAITQVVTNLLDNAVKFSAVGAPLRLSLQKAGGKARIVVENTGEPISPQELPLIFDRFHKTDRSRSIDRDGVGLGLYIVKTIITKHGEKIDVTSENGVTAFTFTLKLDKI